MRHWIGVACLLAAIAAPPGAAAAQAEAGAGDSDAVDQSAEESARGLRRWHPEAYERPSTVRSSTGSTLELEVTLEPADVEALSVPPPDTSPEARLRRAKAGIAASSLLIAIGVGAIAGAVIAPSSNDDIGQALTGFGVGVALGGIAFVGGFVGVGISGHRLNEAKHELRAPERADQRSTRRVRWDPPAGRFRF